jgi:uncharacterized protein with PIN domain
VNKEGYVLDASALLAVLSDEPGAERIRATLADARISAVNLSEVVAKLLDVGVPDYAIDDVRLDLDLRSCRSTPNRPYRPASCERRQRRQACRWVTAHAWPWPERRFASRSHPTSFGRRWLDMTIELAR